jgi:hypothetical protein
MATEDSTYRVREFSQATGVSVRALHHYDRLGLLKPRRTASGCQIPFPAGGGGVAASACADGPRIARSIWRIAPK